MSARLQEVDAVLTEHIRPQTFPVAVKIFQGPEGLPEKMKLPTKTFNHPLAMCQGITLARKYGWTVGFFKEDLACAVGQVILGYVEEPEFIKDGSLVYPLYTDSLEAGARTQSQTPRITGGNTYCIVAAPLQNATFEPDVVIVYGNGAQIARMVQGALYKEGGCIESRFSGRGSCGGEITVPYVEQKCNVIIPGGGERIFALTQDDELAFAIPSSKLEAVIEGIVATHKSGIARIPTPIFGVRAQPEFPKYYWELERHCGLRDS